MLLQLQSSRRWHRQQALEFIRTTRNFTGLHGYGKHKRENLYQPGLCRLVNVFVNGSVSVLTKPFGLIDELSRALHEQLVQSLLGGFVRFGRRSATHTDPFNENVRQQVQHDVPGFVSCS